MLEEKFDCAISLEVAEHLSEDSAETFVHSLTSLSDLVLFGAASPFQGGTGHKNEQSPSWWASFFEKRDYTVYDPFRAQVWSNKNVSPWYKQNTFLYARVGSQAHKLVSSAGLEEMDKFDFMDCVHPEIYLRRATMFGAIKSLVMPLLPDRLIASLRATFGQFG